MTSVGTYNEINRLIWLEKILADLPAGIRILDAGAGEQQHRNYCAHLDYVSQDFAKYDGSGNCAGLQMGTWDQTSLDIVSDITAIPEPDASFEAIMCIEVLEHLPDPLAAITEFARLLKDDGHLIITAPFCSLTHFAPYHFASGFNSYFYEKHLPDAGFDITELIPNGNYFEYLAQEIRRLCWVAEHYAKYKTTIVDTISINFMLKALERQSKKDKGSSELLCFGYHVVAKKRSKRSNA